MDKATNKLINQLTKSSPYFKKFSQKRYSRVKGYIDYDTVIMNLASCLLGYEFSDTDFFRNRVTHSMSLIVLHKLYNDDFNSYWLAPDLCNAFTKTELPDNLEHLQQVIPAGVLMLPPMVKNPDGQLLKWVAFYHRRADERIPIIKLGKSEIDINHEHHDTLTWTTMLDDGTQYGGNVRISDHNAEEINEFFDNYDMDEDFDKTTEKQFTELVTALILQTLLYLQLKQEKTNYQPFSHGMSKKGKNQKLAPLFIGKDYQYQKASDDGTGINKATHWRRGFYRWQPYGTRDNPQYKLLWIEPTLVNG